MPREGDMRSELGRARGGADVNAQQEEAERPKGLSAAFSLISRQTCS